MKTKHVLMDQPRMAEALSALAAKVLEDIGPDIGEVALIGVRSRGELVAQRVAGEMERLTAARGVTLKVPVGALDITMYRDDLNHLRGHGRGGGRAGRVVIPQGTEINFGLDGKIVILIDTVLETGRSVRAALDALVDFGRPRMTRLLVLVDRGGREFPVAADYVGIKAEAQAGEKVYVRLTPRDERDEVFVGSVEE